MKVVPEKILFNVDISLRCLWDMKEASEELVNKQRIAHKKIYELRRTIRNLEQSKIKIRYDKYNELKEAVIKARIKDKEIFQHRLKSTSFWGAVFGTDAMQSGDFRNEVEAMAGLEKFIGFPLRSLEYKKTIKEITEDYEDDIYPAITISDKFYFDIHFDKRVNRLKEIKNLALVAADPMDLAGNDIQLVMLNTKETYYSDFLAGTGISEEIHNRQIAFITKLENELFSLQ